MVQAMDDTPALRVGSISNPDIFETQS
jgi:hypothetical protein